MVLYAVIGNLDGRTKGSYVTMDEAQAAPLLEKRILYDGAAFSQLSPEEKNAVYASVPAEKNLSELDKWLFAMSH